MQNMFILRKKFLIRIYLLLSLSLSLSHTHTHTFSLSRSKSKCDDTQHSTTSICQQQQPKLKLFLSFVSFLLIFRITCIYFLFLWTKTYNGWTWFILLGAIIFNDRIRMIPTNMPYQPWCVTFIIQ